MTRRTPDSAKASTQVGVTAQRAPAAGPDVSSYLPRYRSIAAELSRRIADQQYPPGSLLPSEAELALEFGVTRMTVRQALAGLAAQGLIERRQGHGTIVMPIKLERQADRPISLAAELIARGLKPGSHVLKLDEIRPFADVRARLRLGPRGKVIRLRRLRYADGVLIGLQETLVPSRHAPGLLGMDFENASLTTALREQHGLAATYADLSIEAVAANRRLAADLGIEIGDPLLKSTRVSYLDDGRPLEQTVGWYLGGRYSYQIRQGSPGTP
jgi:GntR family transcriptional regulator